MSGKTIEDIYQKKDLHQHILDRPDTYIGSTKKTCEEQWVFKDDSMVKTPVEFVPGLLKIFDEILVNAIDHTVRDPTANVIKVNISNENISVYNNGTGIPVVEHAEYKIYIPELIFGNLLTSSNYDDNSKRVVGGVNGLGSKTTNVFSKTFSIETIDEERKKHYFQEFSKNMYEKTEPKITKSSKKSFTKITFTPDYRRFGMKGLTEDAISLMKKRVYDCTACTNKKVSVYLNDVQLKAKEFQQYIQLFSKEKFIYEKIEDGEFIWEYAVNVNETYEQISFVNGIATTQGGRHVDHITNQVVKKLTDMILSKKKIENVKASYIKDKIFVFVRATILNPSFSNQSKEVLTTPVKDFGVKIEVSEQFITKLYKTGIVEEVISFTNYKNQKDLAKSTDGKRKNKIKVAKLEDAHFAGTNKSKECSLILTEGDSAKTFAISGLSIIGRERYGVFPLRGKLLNVREATQSQLLKNEEINNLKIILGLQHGKKYTSVESLRYGSIVLLTDSDVDGSHIKCLLVNMFHTWWPELLEIKGFIRSMKTPIVKITKGPSVKEFYTLKDFKDWENKGDTRNWLIKYYKGLGTSTSKEAKEIFKKISTNMISYTSDSVDDTTFSILLAFEKKQADMRKEWLQQYNFDLILDQADTDVSYTDLVNKELIHFSMYDVIRSVPSIADGLKPSQRKVLYTMFKKNYSKEVKVAQFGAAVAEATSYHHGEVSLYGTIINMAQDFVGSNNINLMKPNGAFGTRISGGKDAASPRYIFTELNEIAYTLFEKADFEILKYLEEDSQIIEPVFYVPVVPMILINGAHGIGTGYSTSVPCFNIKDILKNMKLIISGKEPIEMSPWYRGFKGSIIKNDDGNFTVYGVISDNSDKSISITELPVGIWTEDYKEFLENFVDDNKIGINNYVNNSTETDVNFKIIFTSSKDKEKFLKNTENVYKTLKLTKSISMKNLHLFDTNGAIKKYESAEDILREFVKIRLDYNLIRKDHLIQKYSKELNVFENRIRFLEEIIDSVIVVYKKTKDEIQKILEKRKYDKIDDSYNYLVSMPIYSFQKEKIEELKNKHKTVDEKLKTIKSKTPKDILIDDLGNIKI